MFRSYFFLFLCLSMLYFGWFTDVTFTSSVLFSAVFKQVFILSTEFVQILFLEVCLVLSQVCLLICYFVICSISSFISISLENICFIWLFLLFIFSIWNSDIFMFYVIHSLSYFCCLLLMLACFLMFFIIFYYLKLPESFPLKLYL